MEKKKSDENERERERGGMRERGGKFPYGHYERLGVAKFLLIVLELSLYSRI